MEAHGEGMPAAHAPGAHEHAGLDEELGFLRTYLFSTDHKTIGIQYMVTGLGFLFFGFMLMMLMRWQLAYPGEAIPLIGGLLGVALGSGFTRAISALIQQPVVLSPGMILAGLSFAVVVGILFGFYPAVKAARLNPIQALRYE